MMRVATARRPRPFSLASEPGCVLALEARRGVYSDVGGTTVATNGQGVAALQDQIGGTLWTQATSSQRPTLVSDSGYRGQPSLRFVYGSSQFLYNAAWSLAYSVGAWSWVAAFVFTDGVQPSPFGLQGDVLTPRIEFGVVDWYYSASRSGGFGAWDIGANLWVCWWDGAQSTEAGKLRAWVHGAERSGTYGGGGSMSSTTPAGSGLYLGRGEAGGGSYISMDLFGLWGFNTALAP